MKKAIIYVSSLDMYRIYLDTILKSLFKMNLVYTDCLYLPINIIPLIKCVRAICDIDLVSQRKMKIE